MKESFASALTRVLVYEGGKVDNPKDPGGRTNQGIIQRTYNAFRQRKGRAIRSVYEMDAAERDEIYRLQYWDAIKADQLPVGLDFAVFDGAVHSGAVQAVKWLQRAVGVLADGHIGQITLEAIETHPDIDSIIAGFCNRRRLFCRALKPYSTFGHGWDSRIAAVQGIAQLQAAGSVGPMPTYASGSERKALLSDAKPAPQTILADASAGGGFSVSGALAVLEEKLQPVAGIVPHVDQVLAWVTVIGIIVGLIASAYALYARKRAAVLADRLDTKPMQLAASPAVTDTADVPSG